jgi:hypothetical protein
VRGQATPDASSRGSRAFHQLLGVLRPATSRSGEQPGHDVRGGVRVADGLDRVYEQLGSRIGTRKEQREVSAAFAAGGLALLLGGLGTGLRWRSRLA